MCPSPSSSKPRHLSSHSLFFLMGGSVLAALLLFALWSGPFSFTFLADDWGFFAAVLPSGHLAAEQLGSVWARLPVWCLAALVTFRPHWWQTHWPLTYFFFALHCMASVSLVWWLARQWGLSLEELGHRRWGVVAVLVIFCWYPNNYEILYWPTCMPYTIGACAMACGLWAVSHRRFVIAGVCLLLSFLTYESFILPSLVFLVLPWLFQRFREPSKRASVVSLRRPLLVWGVASISCVLVRAAVGNWLGSTRALARIAPLSWLAGLARTADVLFSVHFPVSYGLPTILQWVVVIALLLLLGRGVETMQQKRMALFTGLIVGLVMVSAGLHALLAYRAARAVYGSNLLIASLLACLALFAMRRHGKATLVAMGLLGLTYLGFAGFIFATKDGNARQLERIEATYAKQLQRCTSPCRLKVVDLSKGLRRDWVLPFSYWPGYLRILHFRYAPQKQVHFELHQTHGARSQQLMVHPLPRAKQ